MKTHRLIKSLLLTAVLLLGGGAAEAQVLVAGTDFDGLAANKTWGAISDITYTGMITPTITMYANTPADVDYIPIYAPQVIRKSLPPHNRDW